MKKLKFLIVLVMLFVFGAGSVCVFAGPAKFARQVDRLIGKELGRLEQAGREGIDDYTFCRRVYLDAIGRIPTVDELDAFIGASGADKRGRLVEKLLDSKGYTSHWYNYWADLLRVKYVGDKLHHPGNYGEWIKASLRENKPYDVMVHELVNARGELYKPGNGATGFYAREPMALDHLANSVKTFLGMSIECAQCHDHPTEDWSQRDFYQLAAFSSRTHLRVDPAIAEEKATYAKERARLKKQDFDEWIVYRESLRVKHASIYGNGTGFMRLPHDYQYEDGEPFDVMAADVLFGEMPAVDYQITEEKLETLKNNNFGPEVNSRQSLADWMTSRDNPMFTKATVNRLWHQVMGSELVGAVGSLTLEEMGAHPALTEKLMGIMKAVDFDTKAFLRVLFNSKTYQSKALAVGASEQGPEYVLDGPVVRRLSAEVLVDSFLSLKTETPDKYVSTEFKWDGFTNFYDKSREMGVEDFVEYSVKGPGRGAFQAREEREAKVRNGDAGPRELWRISSYGHVDGKHGVAILMGQSTRDLIDSSNFEPDIPQILYLMNGTLEDEITTQGKAYLHRKLEGVEGRAERMAIIWKAILGRLPRESEEGLFEHAQDDVIWALLNSNEFKFVR